MDQLQFYKLQNQIFQKTKQDMEEEIRNLKNELEEAKRKLQLAARDAVNSKVERDVQASFISKLKGELVTQIELNTQLQTNLKSLLTEVRFARQLVEENESLQYQGVLSVVKDYIPDMNCIEAILKIGKESRLNKIDIITNDCIKWMKTFTSYVNHNPLNLTNDEIMAIALYTYDLRINGDKDENLYFVFNKMLQKRDNKLMKLWKPYIYYLFSALQKFPNHDITVYRGMPYSDVIKVQYTTQRKIHWSGFSSSSSSLSTAIDFALQNATPGIIMKIKVKKAKCIKQYSFIPIEDEYLLSPNSAFIVKEQLSHKPNSKNASNFLHDWQKLQFIKLDEVGTTFIW